MFLIEQWLKFMKWGLIFTPPVMVFVFLIVPVIDSVSPWNVAESELDNYGRDGLAICVGMSSSRSRRNSDETIETQRCYLLISKAELAFITETTENGAREVTLESSKLGFWIVPTLFLLLVWLSARISIPYIKSKFDRSRTR